MNELAIYENFSPLTSMSKKDIEALATKQAEYVKDIGESDKAWAFLRKTKELIETTMDNIKEDAMNSIQKGNDSFNGVNMTIKSRTTQDYSNDAEWVRLRGLLKDRELFLQGIKGSFDVVDEEGVVTTLYPPIKKVSDYIEGKF